MRSIPIPPSNQNTPSSNTLAPTTNTIVTTTSPWHSPVPYLFGGLSIIMALIAVALFMLACSYWRLTRTQQSDLENNNNNVVKEGDDDDTQNKEQTKVYEEKILVIMAGDHKPTFLATPSSSLVIGNHDFHKHIGNSEDCDDDDENKSHKEIIHKHDDDDVVVDATHENDGSSQHEQHGDE